MPIPERLRPPPPTAEDVAYFTDLCRRIKDASPSDERDSLLECWNRRADPTPSELGDFLLCRGDDDTTRMFVTEMLLGTPSYIEDLRYDELRAVVETMRLEGLSTPDANYYFRWLKINLPDSGIFALLCWPGDWFGFDEDMLHVELTHDQILAYAMAKSGRRLPDAPENVTLPYPIPS